ncbi:Ig-like domain-containing protein [Microbacterium sp. W1N]|nr:Ig-like domain-containing protein [Microbacterium festucae]
MALPATVAVTYNDDTTADEAVTWSEAGDYISGPGTYRIAGVTASGHATTVTVTVAAVNLLRNASFETADVSMWSRTGAALTLRATDDPRTGTRSAHFYSGAAYTYTLSQTVTGLAAGRYTASGALQGDGEGDAGTVQLTVTSGDQRASAPFALTGWRNWSVPTTDAITVGTGGSATVTVTATLPAGAWGTLDDLVLTRAITGADTTALQDAVATARGLDRAAVTPASLEGLDAALEIADVVLASSAPAADVVAGALARVQAALAALEPVGPEPAPTVVPVSLTVAEGERVVLPDTVSVRRWNGAVDTQQVTWSAAVGDIAGPGTYPIPGTTAAGLAASATVTVTARQWIVNPGFEDADTTMWQVTGTGASIGATADAAAGARAVSFWSDAAYAFQVTQRLTGVTPGTYTLAATAQGDGEAAGDSLAVVATTSTGAVSAALGLDGWRAWSTGTTPVFTVGADGALTVAVAGRLAAGAWGTLDAFTLVRAGDRVSTDALAAAADAAAGLDPAAYTAWSYERVVRAVERARVIVAADWPAASQVEAATAALAEATAGLVAVGADAATAAPAAGVLSHDNGWDTGLHDGAYNVRMNLWWGQNASSLRLYENGVLIATTPLTYDGSKAQHVTVPVTGKVNGTYRYTAVLANTRGETALTPLTVTVTAANPGAPVLSHDNGDRDGTFTVTADMWWGTNATAYRFYQDGALVAEGALTPRTPQAQRAVLPVTGLAKGSHVYRVEFVNAAGATTSAPLIVAVTK